jgi:hypothetical protein
MTDYNGQLTDGTNIMVDALADSQKLIPQSQRWYPEKNNYNDDEIDDKFDDYVTHNDIPINNQNSEHNTQNFNNTNNNYDDKTDNGETIKSNTNKFIDEEYENLSALEKRLKRLDIMRALGELRDLGCKVTNYNIDDDYYMMKYELDLHRSIRAKRNWLGLYSHMMVGVVKGVELLNNNYNPFDFSLKGLSDEVTADKNTYYEILGEIYEYHNVSGKKMNPWFRLMVTLVGAVVMVGGKNNAHKFIPNKSSEVEDDDAYIEKLRAKAAKDSQSQLSQNKNSQNKNQEPQKNNLDEYMNKQHEHAAQKAKDLEELKRQELEYQKYQQMLSQNRDKFNQMKKSLEMTTTASPSARSVSSKKESVKSSARSHSSRKEKKASDTMSEMSTHSSKTTETSQSGISQISINKNLASRLRQNTNKSKKSNDISMDQISFGSNKKK